MINDVLHDVINFLESMECSVFMADTVPDSLPDEYITFWNCETRKSDFYNNSYHSVIFRFYVTVYAKNPLRANELVEKMDALSTSDMRLETLGNDFYVRDLEYTGRTVVLRYTWRK